MASTIIIKNGAGSSTPSSLKQGELAINVDNGKLFFGTSGSSNSVSSSFSFQHITASGTGSFTEIVTTSTGSFGHLFVNGTINIPVVGNDPAGIIQVNGVNYISGTTNDLNIGNTSKILDLRGTNVMVTGSISASGDISASGTIEAQNFLLGSVGSIKVKDTSGNTDDTAVVNLADVGLTFGDTDILSTVQGSTVTLDAVGDVKIDSATGLIRFQDSTVDSIVFNAQNGVGQITASGNISSSGTGSFRALNITDDGAAKFNVDTNGHVSASGNLSASGNVEGGGINIFQNGDNVFSVTNEGNVSASGDLAGTSLTLKVNGAARASINTSGDFAGRQISASDALHGTQLILATNGATKASIDASGNIAAEGAISASGRLTGTEFRLESNGTTVASISTDGSASFNGGIDTGHAGTASLGLVSASRVIAQGTDEGAQVALKDNDGNDIAVLTRVGTSTNAHKGQLVLRDNADLKVQIKASGTSYIMGDFSSSANIEANTFTQTNNGVTGFNTDVRGNITGSEISSSGTIHADTLIGNGTTTELAVNGDISSSAILKANQILLANNGINTLRVANTGAISSSSTIQGTAFTAQTNGATRTTIDANGHISTLGNVSSSQTLSGTSLDIRSAGVVKAQIDTQGVVTASAYHGAKHILKCKTLYVNDDPWVQNSVYLGHTIGNNPSNYNDPIAVGGAITSTNTITIPEDDMNWGYILPFDISKVEIQSSMRPALGDGADFTVVAYTGSRQEATGGTNVANMTLTKIGNSSGVTFDAADYVTNDISIDYNGAKGTLLFVGFGTEDSTDAKNGRGLLNVVITQR